MVTYHIWVRSGKGIDLTLDKYKFLMEQNYKILSLGIDQYVIGREYYCYGIVLIEYAANMLAIKNLSESDMFRLRLLGEYVIEVKPYYLRFHFTGSARLRKYKIPSNVAETFFKRVYNIK